MARSATGYLMYQTEAGTQCPQTMTFAAIPPLVAHGTDAQRNLCECECEFGRFNG